MGTVFGNEILSDDWMVWMHFKVDLWFSLDRETLETEMAKMET